MLLASTQSNPFAGALPPNARRSEVVRVNTPGPDRAVADAVQRALAQAVHAFALVDAESDEHTVLWANAAFEALTGVSGDRLIGRPARTLVSPDLDLGARERLATLLASGEAATFDLTGVRPDGVPYPARVRLSPIREDRGAVTHWLGEVTDTSAEVALEAERRAAALDAQSARAANVLVAQLGDILADREDPLVLREVASLMQHSFLEWVAFFLDDDGLHPADGISRPVGAAARPRVAPRIPDPVAELLAGPPVVATVPVDLTADWAAGTETARFINQVRVRWSREGIRHDDVRVTAVPGRTRVLGLLAWVPRPAPSGTADGPGDGVAGAWGSPDRSEAVVTFVARRVGLTVENARAYSVEHRLAQTLQRAMLPDRVDIPGLDTWSYYAPGSSGSQVGGDWYEVLGTETGAVVVVGDVVGHDIEAAAVMGQLRSIVRAYAAEGGGPAAVLDRVDRLLEVAPLERFASLVAVALTPGEDGSWWARYTRAGHLPGLIVRDDSADLLDDAGGHLIGVGGGPRPQAEIRVRPGEALVLFTDGLIERRDRSLAEGLADLALEAARAVVLEAAGLGEDLVAFAEGPLVDDVALVVVRVPETDVVEDPIHRPRRRRWELPHEPASIAAARRAVVHQCEAWGLDEVSAAELVVSELVANAVLHGWGPIGLRLEDTGEGLRIEVSDHNPAPPVAVTGLPGRVGGYGVRILERLGEWGWRPTPQGKTVWARVRGESGGPGTDG